ncbi:MAG: SDR family NAD(P)-dependent oxidoreductase [Asticcacaulis sp.]
MFGYGLIGQAFGQRSRAEGYGLMATARDADKRDALTQDGISAIDPADALALGQAAEAASAILITSPPTDEGCPAFEALWPYLQNVTGKWIGYLSTTGVYGDHGGGWVFEDTPVNPQSREAARRVTAENQWRSLTGHDVVVFRLPGLYGAGRSVIEKLQDGTARRIHKPDQVFSRLYDVDAADALWLSVENPRAGAVYNLCDDEPAPADLVIEYAAQTYGFKLSPSILWDDPCLSPAVRRFYAENKRVSNALAKAELGWRPRFPTYREGLADIIRACTPQ